MKTYNTYKWTAVPVLALLGVTSGCSIAADESIDTVSQAATVTNAQRPVFRGVSISGGEWDDGPMFPSPGEVDYFLSVGMTTIRIPFDWPRLQPTPLAPFNATEWNKLDTIVRYAASRGASVVLDPHNFGAYKGNLLGSPGAPLSYFADLWTRLARVYRDNGRVIFGLMNEPHDLTTEQWLAAANRAIGAIRGEQAANLVLVPGNGWSGAPSWFDDWYGTPNSVRMLGVVDPYDNYAYEFHQYLDEDNAGEGACTGVDVGVRGVAPVIAWLRQNHRRGFLGEIGIWKTATCYAALARTLRLIEQSTDVMLGWGMWAAGLGWDASYPMNLEPLGGIDAPQIHAVRPFLTPLARRGVILSGPEYGPIPGRVGLDYIYPTATEIDHFLRRGMTTIALPFRWERLQPTARGPLAAAELSRLDATISAITTRGGTALLRLYGRPEAFGGVVGASLPDATFADLWSKLAARYKNNKRVAFGLASYVHDVTTTRWASAAQAAITAIRAAGNHQLVVVSGNGWSDAATWSDTWYGTSNANAMASLSDPENNFAFDARLFVDASGSGTTSSCVSADAVSARLRPFVDWLRARGRRGFVGAFGGPGTPACLTSLARGANEIASAHDVLVGYAYSEAGPWTADEPYSIEPTSAGERPQWSSLNPILRGLSAEIVLNGAWSGGYCAEVSIRNEGAPAAAWRSVRVRFDRSQLTAMWDATFSAAASVLTITPSASATIASGNFVKVGFCARYTGARPSIEVLSAD